MARWDPEVGESMTMYAELGRILDVLRSQHVTDRAARLRAASALERVLLSDVHAKDRKSVV